MNNKNDIHIHLHKKPSKKEQLVPMTLLPGDWRKDFTELECQVMIAEALNTCVYNDDMKIAGYLITRRRLCLILLADPAHVAEQLQQFYKELRKEIAHRLQRRKNIHDLIFEKQELTAVDKHAALFIKFPMQNYMLVSLLTGRKVELPYYSPYLARLQDRVNAQNFCSAMDYTGAKSPVMVTLLK